ncbi:VOC family protein [Methylopila turkensis]|uniref:VOC family protein n=1 Tax=Methylopila turkensis TaxID=1437816 RepID=UPI0022F30DF0|nr:VOC family protein [Methylopila turkensis]
MSFYWTELNTRYPDSAKLFYSATMGWTFRQAGEAADYWLVFKDDKVVGGLYHMHDAEFDGVPEHWFSYVEVDDVDVACATAVAAGGNVLRKPTFIPNVGRIAILSDPAGSPIGCISPEREAAEIAA